MCKIESNGLEESIWLYTIRLIKGRDFVIPTETPVTGYVCVVSAGDIEVSSNSSSTIGTEYSMIYLQFVNHSLESGVVNFCTKVKCNVFNLWYL